MWHSDERAHRGPEELLCVGARDGVHLQVGRVAQLLEARGHGVVQPERRTQSRPLHSPHEAYDGLNVQPCVLIAGLTVEPSVEDGPRAV